MGLDLGKLVPRKFVQGLFFHHLAGSGPPKTPAREIDQGIFYSSYLFSFKPSESTFAPLVAGILQCTWERFSPVAVLRCCPAKPDQGHFALLTLSLAFGPVKSDHIWKGICAIIWVEKKWLVLAVAMFCHSSFLIRDKALGQLR